MTRTTAKCHQCQSNMVPVVGTSTANAWECKACGAFERRGFADIRPMERPSEYRIRVVGPDGAEAYRVQGRKSGEKRWSNMILSFDREFAEQWIADRQSLANIFEER